MSIVFSINGRVRLDFDSHVCYNLANPGFDRSRYICW